ncbi:MAG: hypothetical protein Kow00107_07530 [Planctomycetota bacterium]
MRKFAAITVLLLVLGVTASSEEAPKYEIGHKLTKGQLLSYEIQDTKKTLITDPQTAQAIIITLTSTIDSKRAIFDQEGIWMRTVEMYAFRDLRVDEATATGIQLPQEEIDKNKMAELKTQRLDNDIFSFSTMSEFGQPDPAQLNSSDVKTVLSGAAGTIAFLPPAKRSVGDFWKRDITIGAYSITIEYNFDQIDKVDGREIAVITGEVRFNELDKGDLMAIVREISYVMKLDIAAMTIVEADLNFVVGITKEGKVVQKTNIIKRKLVENRMMLPEELEKAKADMDAIKMAKSCLDVSDHAKAYSMMKHLLKNPESPFAVGFRVFARDRIFINWEVKGRLVEELWFSEYLNTEPVDMAKEKGHAMVIAFFDPEISSSTRIWRPFDDWAENFGPKGLKLLAASSAEKEKVKAYIAEMGIKHPIALDNDYLMLNYFQVEVVPTFFVLDSEGRIVLRVEGKRDMHLVHKKLEEFYGVIPE